MELQNLHNGGIPKDQASKPDIRNPNNGEQVSFFENSCFHDEIDSSSSTPYVSAPSSPGRGSGPSAFFFSAPASPMHFILSSSSASKTDFISASSDFSADFEFSARFTQNSSSSVGSMISADELFLNGQIRPMKLSSHLQRPQNLAPLLDLDTEDEYDDETKDTRQERVDEAVTRGRDLRLRSRSLHRKSRSLSPLRNWRDDEEEEPETLQESDPKRTEPPSDSTTPSVSASSSRSSSTSSRSSKRWVFLMDLLHRSKSEGRGNSKERFWPSISFSTSQKDKKSQPASRPSSPTRNRPPVAKTPASSGVKPANAVGKRRVPPSPHELLYKTNRAQAEEMKRKTFLPYRQGLLGCLGFSSKGYGAMSGLARTLNPVSSR